MYVYVFFIFHVVCLSLQNFKFFMLSNLSFHCDLFLSLENGLIYLFSSYLPRE